jgi:fluoroquinolone transport system permease protein
MKQLLHLLGQDFRLLYRYQIVTISIVVSAMYVGLFHWLSGLGNVDRLLILLIFNDPALLGFLFIGVLVLFERNEGTLAALAVVPLQLDSYLLSKALSLSAIAVACCFAMVLVAHTGPFRPVHFGMASLLASLLFAFLGFIVVAPVTSFNAYILRVIVVVIPISLSFLGYFGLVPWHWFFLFPTYPIIGLYELSLASAMPLGWAVIYYALALLWCGVAYAVARRVMQKSFAV